MRERNEMRSCGGAGAPWSMALVLATAALLTACTTMPPASNPLLRQDLQQLMTKRKSEKKGPLAYHVAVAPPEPPAPPRKPGAAKDANPVTAPKEPIKRSAGPAEKESAGKADPKGPPAPGKKPEPVGSKDKAAKTQVFDAAKLQQGFAKNLDTLKLFTQVSTIKPFKPARDEEGQRKLLLTAGEELRCDLILRPRFRRFETSYVETSGWWVPSWIAGVFFWFPTFWMPDERWAATVEMEWELIYLRTGETMVNPVYTARVLASMDDFDRGWDFCGPWGIPLFTNTFMGVEDRNFAAVGRHLLPAALADAEGELLYRMANYLDKNRIKARGAAPQTFALVVGCDGPSRLTPGLELSCASKDAISMAEYLRDPNGGEVEGKNLTLLTGAEATRKRVSEFFDVQLQKIEERDRVFIFFAGFGAHDADGKGYLVLQDTDPANVKGTGFPVEKLARVFQIDQRATVILDTSFGGKRGRTLPGSRASEVAKPWKLDELDGPARTRREKFLYLACGAEESALEYPGEGHGIFTLFLLDALRGEADEDRSGKTTLSEVVKFTDERVPPNSAGLGERQRPHFSSQVLEDADQRTMGRKVASAGTPPRNP